MQQTNILTKITKILDLLYYHGWDERNGGNFSYILTEEEALEISNKSTKIIKTFIYDDIDLTTLIDKYIIITGTGTYFKNMKDYPEENLGLMKVLDKHTLGLIWGYTTGGRPTSEAPTHLQCHVKRLEKDPEHRIVMHCHPTNVICMTHILPLDSDKFTEILWKMQTESIVVFPEGVAVLPWLLCGGTMIGVETAKLMASYRSVIWAQHGIFCTGKTLDETFGLVETIEKAAEIYVKVCDKKIYQSISNDNLKEIAEAFKIEYKHGIID